MQFSSALFVAIIAASANAFQLPENEDDGIYISYTTGGNSAKFKRDGSQTIKVADFTYADPGSNSTVGKRDMPINKVTCDNRNILNAWDYIDARDHFKTWCNAKNQIPSWNNGVIGLAYARSAVPSGLGAAGDTKILALGPRSTKLSSG